MNETHPDLAALEAVRTGEASPEEAAHAGSCPDCRTALEGLTALAARLEALPRTQIEVPAVVRTAIRDRAARALRPSRPRWIPLAAAAGLMLGLLGLWTLKSPARLPGDVDGSGRVDIVDAYSLAVDLRNGRSDSAHDLTGDGRVDAADVDEIARLSVSLGDGGGR